MRAGDCGVGMSYTDLRPPQILRSFQNALNMREKCINASCLKCNDFACSWGGFAPRCWGAYDAFYIGLPPIWWGRGNGRNSPRIPCWSPYFIAFDARTIAHTTLVRFVVKHVVQQIHDKSTSNSVLCVS